MSNVKNPTGHAERPSLAISLNIDQAYRELIARHVGEDDFMRNLTGFARRMHFTRALAYWEIFKQVADLPGDIVEVGVYKGETLLLFAKFLEILCPGDRTKRVIGFDWFKGLDQFTAQDGENAAVGNTVGGWNPDGFQDTLAALIDLANRDSFVPQKKRVFLEEGDIALTGPAFVEKEPGLRLSLLHLDVDQYEPTLAALRAFYPRLVTGGIVVLDEYAFHEWPGETAAVEAYFDGKPPRMHRVGWSATPSAWFVKT
jgi:hypothetical protein